MQANFSVLNLSVSTLPLAPLILLRLRSQAAHQICIVLDTGAWEGLWPSYGRPRLSLAGGVGDNSASL